MLAELISTKLVVTITAENFDFNFVMINPLSVGFLVQFAGDGLTGPFELLCILNSHLLIGETT